MNTPTHYPPVLSFSYFFRVSASSLSKRAHISLECANWLDAPKIGYMGTGHAMINDLIDIFGYLLVPMAQRVQPTDIFGLKSLS